MIRLKIKNLFQVPSLNKLTEDSVAHNSKPICVVEMWYRNRYKKPYALIHPHTYFTASKKIETPKSAIKTPIIFEQRY